jgi:predicted RNA-binding Zn ribbon-like protein
MTSRKGHSQFKFDLSGGTLCLDFANTVSNRKIASEVCDHLASYSDLLAFATQARYLPVEFVRKLTAASQYDPQAAGRTLERAHRLREAIYRTFLACADRRSPPPDDLKLIQTMTVAGWKYSWLTKAGLTYRWVLKRERATRPDGLLWPIARSAAELLTSDRLKKVRVCEANTCAWLFLDESRNHSRRWCDMKVCGNREKARRHYQRVHRESPGRAQPHGANLRRAQNRL